MKSELDREFLDHFSMAVLRHFSRLLTDYDFVVSEAHISRPDVWVKLRNETTEVMIDYEWGAGCWITIGRVTRWLKQVADEYSLEQIARTVDPTAPFPDVSSFEYEHERIDEVLQKLACVLFSKAAGLLRGDFSISRQLQARDA